MGDYAGNFTGCICQIGRSDVKSPLSIINAVVAIGAGLLVLAGYFVPGLEVIRSTVLGWAAITAGFALLAGVLNLLAVHWSKINSKPAVQSGYSIILLVSFLITLVVTLLSGPTGEWTLWIFKNIQVPIETSLLALLAVTLAAASIQLVRRRFDVYTALFLITALVVLMASAPLYGVGDVTLLYRLRDWLLQVPAMAGIRGILMGVALGSIATGLRILMGADRPYGG